MSFGRRSVSHWWPPQRQLEQVLHVLQSLPESLEVIHGILWPEHILDAGQGLQNLLDGLVQASRQLHTLNLEHWRPSTLLLLLLLLRLSRFRLGSRGLLGSHHQVDGVAHLPVVVTQVGASPQHPPTVDQSLALRSGLRPASRSVVEGWEKCTEDAADG